jgi:hypothetical protein
LALIRLSDRFENPEFGKKKLLVFFVKSFFGHFRFALFSFASLNLISEILELRVIQCWRELQLFLQLGTPKITLKMAVAKLKARSEASHQLSKFKRL